MPISVPPVTRRKFLIQSLLAGSALAFRSRLPGASLPTTADSWALLADIHIAADETVTSRGVNMADHFTKAIREVAGLSDRPAGVFVVGDCAYSSGEKGDYGTLTRLLTPARNAGIPIHLGLGNHDNRERFWDALQEQRLAKRPLIDRHVALVRSPHANWFLLDSLETTLSVPGFLGADQLDWLARTLDENPDKPALIVVHHNPDQSDKISGMRDTEALFAVIRPRTQVKAFIFGHTHDWKVTPDKSGIHLVNLPPVAYVFNPGRPSGWIHARTRQNGIQLRLNCIDRSHPLHDQLTDLQWRA
jgi:3',5'-cyclic-AMP phosphodiesterase